MISRGRGEGGENGLDERKQKMDFVGEYRYLLYTDTFVDTVVDFD